MPPSPRVVHVTPDAPRRVFVNQPQDAATPPAREVTVEARVDPAQAGVPVFFVYDVITDRTSLLIRENMPLMDGELASDARAETDAEGVARVTLALTYYGGERMRVGATTDVEVFRAFDERFGRGQIGNREAQLAAVREHPNGDALLWSAELEVWRTVHYQLTLMRADPESGFAPQLAETLAQARAELARAYVAFEPVGDPTSVPHQPLLLRDPKALRALAEAHQVPSPPPAFVHLLGVDALGVYAGGLTANVRLEGDGPHTIRLGAPGALTFVPAEDDWFVSASWTREGQLVETETQRPETIRLRRDPDAWRLDVARSEAGAEADACRIALDPLEVQGGLSIGAGVFLSLRGYSDGDAELTQRLLHEIGHLAHLAAAILPNTKPIFAGQGERAGDHETSTHRFNGMHCKRVCVMSHQLGGTTQFCERCRHALRGRRLHRLPIPAVALGDYTW